MERNQQEEIVRDHPDAGNGVTAMIFAAGLGTRFKPWTDSHPKALAEVHGRPLLQHAIEYLQLYGIKDVIVNVHHFAGQVVEAIERNNGWGSHVLISDESDAVLETGGGLLNAKHLLHNSTVLTINVDILTDLDLHAFLTFHRQQQSLITLAVTDRKTSRYLLFDESGRLCGWRNTQTGAEKGVLHKETLVEKAYSGIALFQSSVFGLIPFTGKFSLIDVYLHLAPDYKIMAYDHSGGKFIDVGKPGSVAEAEQLFTV